LIEHLFNQVFWSRDFGQCREQIILESFELQVTQLLKVYGRLAPECELKKLGSRHL